MGLLDQAKAALGSASGQQQQQAPADGQAPAAGASTGQQDALDKGVDAFLKKTGHGQNVGTTEKISDGVRSAFKSVTGKDVPIEDKQ